MATKLFVGGLPYSTTEDELKAFFEQAGAVVSAKIIMDRETGRSKGFGFVEMETEEGAKEATEKLNGATMGNRTITVNEARPMPERNNRQGGFSS